MNELNKSLNVIIYLQLNLLLSNELFGGDKRDKTLIFTSL